MRQIKAVLLAGGSGERFWPRSRPWLPKQFLDLDGSGSLLQATYRRVRAWLDAEDIYVSTRAEYGHLVREHLPELPEHHLILEPEGRDTAPSLGLAALILGRENPDAVLLALPADHVIGDEMRYFQTLQAAAAAAMQWQGLVTLGLNPTRPETGYGYIHVGDAVGEYEGLALHRVHRFVEKPDLPTARRYLQSGEFLWNSGMFAGQVRTLREEIVQHLPDLAAILQELEVRGGDSALAELFARAPKVSFDYAILEKSHRVFVLPAYFGWDDVGTWSALERMRTVDSAGNAVRGQAVLHDAQNVLVEGTPGRLVAAVGVSDLVIVDTEDAVLVCHKNRSQGVRQVARQVHERIGSRPAFPPEPSAGKVVEKPWGREVWWAVTEYYAAKLLEVRAGHSLSLQYHVHKLETMFFQTGRGRLLVGREWVEVGPGYVTTLPPGTIHQLIATSDLTVIEVSTPHLDDIVRLDDRYGRNLSSAATSSRSTARVPSIMESQE